MDFVNCYEDVNRAAAYATLEFANTYYLAYRDLPAILSRCVIGTRALDFGCGTGRSTRVLQKHGFNVTALRAKGGPREQPGGNAPRHELLRREEVWFGGQILATRGQRQPRQCRTASDPCTELPVGEELSLRARRISPIAAAKPGFCRSSRPYGGSLGWLGKEFGGYCRVPDCREDFSQ